MTALTQLFSMHGYGVYIFPTYALMLVFFGWHWWRAWQRWKQLLSRISHE